MLESFEIINFRLFEHLQVKKLSRVNLIVGKNNSGKSSFLEALELYVSNASPSVILEQLEYRQDNWSGKSSSYSQTFFDNHLRHLFFGHKLLRFQVQGILLGEIDGARLSIGIAVFKIVKDKEGQTLSRINDFSWDKEPFYYQLDYEFALIAEEDSKTIRFFPIELGFSMNEINIINPRGLHDRNMVEPKYTLQTVPTENMPNKKLSSLWDLTSLNSDLKPYVIEALHLVDIRITGVGFIDVYSEEHSRIPLVTMEGIEEPLPLKSMGDGMMRLFHIILALVNAKNGILLIDEFENGLHWTVQPKVWNVVFQVAERLNVQVFATTHSRDCIAGFEQAWNEYPEYGAFFRLDRKNGTIKATEYNLETLNDSLEMDVEVR
jgi:AAA15 family ATPase/GTPase